MDECAKARILATINKGVNEEDNAQSDFRRGRGVGIQRGAERTLFELGYSVVYEDDPDGNVVAVDIVERG